MRKAISAILSTVPGRAAATLVQRYVTHDIAQQGAALAYYLLFSLFPLLILTSSLISQLDLDISGILRTLSAILPSGVIALVESYLGYASEHTGRSMLFFSLIFSVYFPMRATRCLMRAVRRAYRLPPPKNRVLYLLRVLFYTVLLLFSVLLTLLLASLGREAAGALASFLALPRQFAAIWGLVRFALLGLIVFAALGILYAVAQDHFPRVSAVLPGAFLSTLAWIILSALYSFYVEYISNYALIYGALGTVVALLIWLYLTALTLILGAEINDMLVCIRKGNTRRHSP